VVAEDPKAVSVLASVALRDPVVLRLHSCLCICVHMYVHVCVCACIALCVCACFHVLLTSETIWG
jgi:hypothetical protein